jgi:hypothetical protein
MPDSITTAIISGAALIAAGMMGRWYEQRQANKRPFLEKQLALSFEAVEAASCLANETKWEAWEEARLTFWCLYWGPLSMVEDQTVKGAMEEFGNLLADIPIPAPPEMLPRAELQQPSYRLSHAARNLILSSWKISDLSNLQKEPKTQIFKSSGWSPSTTNTNKS